jgi:RNA polymerase sigma-70 factor (ECF subfamily)
MVLRRSQEHIRHMDDRSCLEAGFAELFRAYHPLVLRFFERRLPSRDAAREAAQETFVRAFSRSGSLRDSDKARPWLFAFARNVLHETWYAHHRDRARVARPARDGDALDVSPEARLLEHERARALDEAIAELPPARRAALLLRVDDERDYPDIARRVGWSRAKVKNELHRARLSLRGHLDRWGRDAA